MTDKLPEPASSDSTSKRAFQYYIAGALLGFAGGVAVGWVLRSGDLEVKERIVPYGVPCAECAKHAADKIAAASAEIESEREPLHVTEADE
jgi:hypothetical protein